MPRITRVEPSVAYQGANMPTASGDWGAPGRALASMGNALAGLGEAFSAEQNQEDEYKTKLALVNFHTQQQQDFDRYKAEYTGDPTQFQAGWNQRYQQSWNAFAPTLPQNPKTLRSANLHGATLGGSLSTHALGQQQTLVHGQNVASVEATINSTLGAIDAADPEKMDQVLDQTIAGINAVIDQAPPGMLTESDKARMRGQAASLALSRMEQKFRDAKIDPMPALKGTIQKWTTDPRLQQAPAPMGPRSDAGPATINNGIVSVAGLNIENGVDTAAPYMRRSRDVGAITRIIVHGDVNENADRLLAYGRRVDETRGFDPNYHFYIRRDGTVIQGVPLDRRANHALRANDNSIGIVIAGADNGKDPTPAQDAAAKTLIASLGSTLKIDPQNVMGHGELQPGRRDIREGGTIAADIRKSGYSVSSSPAGGIEAMATAYSPTKGASDKAGTGGEGSYASAKPGPDGKAEVRTLADVSAGRSKYVTLAGDPSQYGKEYVIPEITFRDASGKEQTLKNVKGVVHDTGSAFNGKGDQRFDIPADRDLPDGGASQPYSKQKIAFLPAGQERQPTPMAERGIAAGHPMAGAKTSASGISAERYTPAANESGIPEAKDRERFVLKGTPEAKARQLREIVAAGYGDVVHSVSSTTGDDVVSVKKGNPNWQTNGVAKDDAPEAIRNRLKDGEFSGPTWAKDVVSEMKSGRVTAPVQEGKVHVADASGKIGAGEYLREKAGDNTIGSHGVSPDTMKRMRPSVQSEMLQRMTTGWKTWEGMQQAWAKEIETRVKAELDVAQSGYEPKPENIAAIKAMIAKSPEVARQYGLDKAVEMIDAAVAKAGIIRQMTPQALEMAVRQMDAAMSGPGGADQAMIEQKKQLEKTLATTRKAINDDPMTWATQAKIPVPLPMPALEPGAKAKFEQPWTVANVQPIDFSSPDVVTQLKMRADVARGVGQYYNQPPQFFTAPERDALKDVFRTGGAPMLHVLGKITEAFGNDAVLAMKEFAKDAPEAAMMGKIMAEGGDAKLLEDASKGLHLRVAEGDKFISHVDKKIVEPDVSSIMPALARTPGLQDPAIRMANAVYEYRHRYMGKDKFDQDLYLKTLKEVLGETRDKDGNVYGGVGEQNAGWFDFKFANKVIVPSGVRQDKFDDLIGAIRDVDLMTLGQPRHGDGTPLTAKDVRGATWQSVGSGKYGLVLGTTANGDPQYAWDTEKNAPFVLDLNLIMPGLRKRVPSVFRP